MKEKKEPTVADVLRRMKALLLKGWTQKTSARGRSGRPVYSLGPFAVSFCLLGAEVRAVNEVARGRNDLSDRVERLIAECIGGGIALFNDSPATTKKDVLDVVDCAIKKSVV